MVDQNLFTSQVPDAVDNYDGSTYTLGTVFTADVAGQVKGIRWYATQTVPSTVVRGALYSWSSDTTGTLLASATFVGLTGGGWNTILFSSPVSISPGVRYVAAVGPSDRFVATGAFFATAPLVNGNLTGIQNTGAGNANGKYAVGAALAYPDSTYNSGSYFVDVVFSPGAGGNLLALSGTAVLTAYRPRALVFADEFLGVTLDASKWNTSLWWTLPPPIPPGGGGGGGTIAPNTVPTTASNVGFRGVESALILADPSHIPVGMTYSGAGGYFELGSQVSRTWDGYRFTRPVKFSDTLSSTAGITLTFQNNVFDIPGNQYLGGLTYQGDHGTNVWVIQDNTFRASSALAGNWGNAQIQMDARATIRRNNISGRADGIQLGGSGNALIEQNYIHDPGNFGTYPNNTHNDGMQFYGGSNIVIRYNRVEIGWDGEHQNGALFFQGNFSQPLISNNYLSGGGYILRLESGVSNAIVTGNQFALVGNPGVPWGPYTHLIQGSVATWSGNVLYPSGATVNL